MTNKQVKKALQGAYQLPESDNEKQFVRTHEQRNNCWSDILQIELKYMGPKSVPALFVLIFLSLIAVKSGDPDRIWIIASLLPLCSLAPMILLQKSGRFQMEEIETASRFSIHFIRLTRMLILGVFSIVSIAVICLVLFSSAEDYLMLLGCMLIPYLICICGGLMITRKWNHSDSVYGVAAVSCVAALLPSMMGSIQNVVMIPSFAYVALMLCLLLLTTIECIKYVNERTYVSWNFC